MTSVRRRDVKDEKESLAEIPLWKSGHSCGSEGAKVDMVGACLLYTSRCV